MTTKIGLSGSEATVLDPVVEPAYEITATQLGGTRRTLSGARIRHIEAQKRTWSVTWSGMTSAQLTTLVTELNRQANLSWKPPDGGTFTVQCDTFLTSPMPQAPDYWQVTATLEEV